MMVILWITEALPLAVTALIGPVLAVILKWRRRARSFAPFADPIIFLFIGSFMLAEAMFVHGLDRRIAFGALSSRAVGGSPARILFVFGAVAHGISMWISNTATTAMMFPIGLSIVAHLTKGRESEHREPQLRDRHDADGRLWRIHRRHGHADRHAAEPDRRRHAEPHRPRADLVLPVDAARRADRGCSCFSSWSSTFTGGCCEGSRSILSQAAHIQEELRKLGPMSIGQRNTLMAFGVTVALWLFPGVLAMPGFGDSAVRAEDTRPRCPESVAAMIGAILLFLLPVNWRARRFTLSWEQAVRIDWGIILLFGGGLAMGELAFSTGLAESIGHGITVVAARRLAVLAHRPLHRHRHRDVRNRLEHGIRQHDRSGGHRGGAGRRRQSPRSPRLVRRSARRWDS